MSVNVLQCSLENGHIAGRQEGEINAHSFLYLQSPQWQDFVLFIITEPDTYQVLKRWLMGNHRSN